MFRLEKRKRDAKAQRGAHTFRTATVHRPLRAPTGAVYWSSYYYVEYKQVSLLPCHMLSFPFIVQMHIEHAPIKGVLSYIFSDESCMLVVAYNNYRLVLLIQIKRDLMIYCSALQRQCIYIYI